MVRRGSTVRVRQRALQEPRNRRFLVHVGLLLFECAVGYRALMEPSDQEEALQMLRRRGSRAHLRGGTLGTSSARHLRDTSRAGTQRVSIPSVAGAAPGD